MTSQPPPVPTRRPPAGPLPHVVLARDVPRAALEAAVRSGELERIRPGAYRRTACGPAGQSGSTGPRGPAGQFGSTGAAAGTGVRTDPRELTPAEARELALARIAAISRKLRTPFWFSHESAALLWGCPLWKPVTETHIIQTVSPNTHSGPLLTRHLMPLPVGDRQERRGVPVTSLDRTVVDCLGRLPPLDSLVIADGALRLGADREAIATRLGALAGRRGVVGARIVLDHADGRAESPWETFLRYVLLRHGLPRPELQVQIRSRLGWFRADAGWREWKLLLEFDGFTKYSTFAGGDPARVLFEEKRRQEAIEEEGWGVLRVTAADLSRPADLISRVCRRLPGGITLTPVRAFAAL